MKWRGENDVTVEVANTADLGADLVDRENDNDSLVLFCGTERYGRESKTIMALR